MDTILINGLEFYAYHGVSDEEQAIGQRYRVDVTMEVDARRAGLTDMLGDTVDYGDVARRIVQIATEQSYRLLEAVATQMVLAILEEFPGVEAVMLRLQKLNPPMNAIVASVGVEIYRTRDDVSVPPRIRLTVVGSDETKEISEEDTEGE